jgi:GntR family transcriptional regulator
MVLATGSGAWRMFFSIDPQGGVAIYEQIVRQVKFAIAEGTLGPGQLLPSVRVLSQQLAINPNTIARAYLQLQADEVVESLRGRGLAVSAGAPQRCHALRRTLIAQRLRSVLAEALHGGLKATEIREIVRNELESLSGTLNTISSDPDEAASP